MYFELALLAYMLDMLFGEFPLKHPVMWMGDYINAFERRFYAQRILPGAALVFSLLGLTWMLASGLATLSNMLPEYISLLLVAAMASTGIAMHMLHSSVAEVLASKDPRRCISYLVSRDTQNMTVVDINKAALETWAENLSDGVIAPLFYLLFFGLPGIAVYKAINTLDSMIAYKTERYALFGKTAAKLDDIANFLPARITALLIVLVAPNKQQALLCMLRDGHKLESPNAGYPIAAIAGALGVALGGNAYYHGQLKHKPTLGTQIHAVSSDELQQGLAMKRDINLIVLSVLLMGILLT